MRRLVIPVFLIALGAVAAIWLAADPGAARLDFRGWVIETSFAALAGFMLVLGLFIALLWRGLAWIVGLPGKVRAGNARARAQRGYDALERALIASAAGDGGKARRQAARAGELLDRPLLARVISARAAESAGEMESAEADYRLMLETPETEIVGLRGLAQTALARGDLEEAARRAETALRHSPQARWAFDALFDAQTRMGRWAQAQATLAEGERQTHVPAEAARRRGAVLLTAEAAEAESAADFDLARQQAEAATRACPAFPPAATLAARLLLREGQGRRARRALEDAWRAAPHPAIALLWRELGDDAAPAAEQAAHMEALARLAPDHRESRFLSAESMLTRGDAAAADAMLAAIAGPRTARLLALMARIAQARGDEASARLLLIEGIGAPGEADWSDIDPAGPAFGYAAEDWARLVIEFGDHGRLIHPRHERFLPELIAAPVLSPAAARPVAPIPAAPPAASAAPDPAGAAQDTLTMPSPDDPGPHGDPEDETPEAALRRFE